MKSKKSVFSCLFSVLLLFFSCSTIPSLNIGYNMPSPNLSGLEGIEISIGTEDARKMKNIIGPGAANDFKSFSGQISLSLIKNSTNRIPVGLFEPDTLFVEAFTRRFEDLGVNVVSGPKAGQIALIVVLREFSLDLVKRKWIVNIKYEARVEKDGNVIYRHDIIGEGERLKLIGTTQADELISEIFTDVINRLNPGTVLASGAD